MDHIIVHCTVINVWNKAYSKIQIQIQIDKFTHMRMLETFNIRARHYIYN